MLATASDDTIVVPAVGHQLLAVHTWQDLVLPVEAENVPAIQVCNGKLMEGQEVPGVHYVHTPSPELD
jgi:hypothetical protein